MNKALIDHLCQDVRNELRYLICKRGRASDYAYLSMLRHVDEITELIQTGNNE